MKNVLEGVVFCFAVLLVFICVLALPGIWENGDGTAIFLDIFLIAVGSAVICIFQPDVEDE